MPHYAELAQRVVLITGGAQGIGQATVRAFHRAGAQVYFFDTDRAAGRTLVRELGPSVVFHAIDLRLEKEIIDWIRTINGFTPTIHTLVNNAAHDPRIPLDQQTTAL